MQEFISDRRGSTVRWFAAAAAVLCAGCLAGARTLDWLTQSGRVALVADRAPAQPRRFAADADVDTMPTGSIPASRSLVIRLR
jgi:hypothetical protein